MIYVALTLLACVALAEGRGLQSGMLGAASVRTAQHHM